MNELGCVADAVGAPLLCPGTPAFFARGVFLKHGRRWGRLEVSGVSPPGCTPRSTAEEQVGGWCPTACPSHGLTVGRTQHRLPKFPSGMEPPLLICTPCLGLLCLGFIFPFLLRSLPMTHLHTHPCPRVTSGKPSGGKAVISQGWGRTGLGQDKSS